MAVTNKSQVYRDKNWPSLAIRELNPVFYYTSRIEDWEELIIHERSAYNGYLF